LKLKKKISSTGRERGGGKRLIGRIQKRQRTVQNSARTLLVEMGGKGKEHRKHKHRGLWGLETEWGARKGRKGVNEKRI